MDTIPQGPSEAEKTHVIVDHHKELSSKKKTFLVLGSVLVMVFLGVGGLTFYQNSQLDAASCVSTAYKVGSQHKCIGYAQKMLNGISVHYANIANNSTTLTGKKIAVNSTYDSATNAQLIKTRSYTATKSAGDKMTTDDWAMLCMWTRRAYRAYTANVRPSDVQTARVAYTNAGCNSAPVVASDDPATPSPVSGTNTTDSIAADTPITDDGALLADADTGSTSAASNGIATDDALSVKVTTWNVAGGDGANDKDNTARQAFSTQRSAGLSQLATTSDVIALQESHLPILRNAITSNFTCAADTCPLASVDLTHTYSSVDASKKSGSLPASIPILWKKTRFELKDFGTYNALNAGYKDANGDWVSLKWINWVKLQDKTTNREFFVVNTHTVAGIESGGNPQTSKAAKQRLKTYVAQMDLMVSLIKYLQEQSLPIFVVGDFNVNYRYDALVKYEGFPEAKLGAVGLKSDYGLTNLDGIAATVGTQGNDVYDGKSKTTKYANRLIDNLYLWDKSNVTYYPITINPKNLRYGSDHSPVTFAVKLN